MARVEHRLWARIKAELDRRSPAVWYQRLVGSRFMTSIPDVMVCDSGRWTLIELKREDGRGILSPKQQYVHERIRAAGGRVFVVDSFSDFMKAMDW